MSKTIVDELSECRAENEAMREDIAVWLMELTLTREAIGVFREWLTACGQQAVIAEMDKMGLIDRRAPIDTQEDYQ